MRLSYTSIEITWRYVGIVMIISTIAMVFVERKDIKIIYICIYWTNVLGYMLNICLT